MKKLALVLLAIVFISCSKSTDSDTKVIGTWLLNSDTEAEWVGESATTKSKSKAKGDTLRLASPENTLLELSTSPNHELDFEGEIRINILYVDSSITASFGEQNDLNLERTFIDFEGAEIGPPPYRLNKRYSEVNNDIHEAHMQFLYTCGNDAGDIEIANINLLYEAENYPWYEDEEFAEYIFQTTSLDITGFKEVLEEEFCTN